MADDRRPVAALAATLSLPAIAAVSLGFLLPVLWLARMSVNPTEPGGVLRDGWTLQHGHTELFTDSFYAELTLASLQMSATATLLALLIGYPIALFLYRLESRWKTLLVLLAICPLLVSGVVRAYGWIVILGDAGWINSMLRGLGLIDRPIRLVNNHIGVAIGLTESLLPYMTLSLLAGLGRLDRGLEEAACTGRVVLPHLPSHHAAVEPAGGRAGLDDLLHAPAVSAFVTPRLLGGGRPAAGDGDLRAGAGYQLAAVGGDRDRAAGVVLHRPRRLRAPAAAGGGMNGIGTVAARTGIALLYVFALAPSSRSRSAATTSSGFPAEELGVRWYVALFAHEGFARGFRVSLGVASMVVALDLLVGVPAAYAIARPPLSRSRRASRLPDRAAAAADHRAGPGDAAGLLSAPARRHLSGPGDRAHGGDLALRRPHRRDRAFDLARRHRGCGGDPGRLAGDGVPPDHAAADAARRDRRLGVCLHLFSFDEVVISLFVVGPRLSTLPVELFRYVEGRTDPMVAATPTVLILATVSAVLVVEPASASCARSAADLKERNSHGREAAEIRRQPDAPVERPPR